MSTNRLVLLHGFGTSGAVWRQVISELDQGTLTPDLQGFGDAAARGKAGQTTGDLTADLARQLRQVGAGPYRVAGHSMGAKVALLLAIRHPELVGELLLIAPSPPGGEPMTPPGRADLRAAHADAAALEAQYRAISRRPLPAPDLAALIRDGVRASLVAWHAWTEVGSLEDLRSELVGSRLSPAHPDPLPIRVLYSEDDPAIPPQTVQDMVLRLLPQATATVIQGVGHLIPLEDPQAVLALIGAGSQADST
ncbi:alpha/beta hydrolase [Deinococcus sp.]|uniref:alpha/beta fold hydrolase n=1 Tax=Deinococcus sp. TaxID=47478 RepID=UPI0025F48391|nr:alpha/beta hydrolase [Deinococcus sp.]